MSLQLSQDMIYYLLIAIAVALTIYFLLETTTKPKEPETETKELLTCPKCGYSVEKTFEPGDFIGMIKGNVQNVEHHYESKQYTT